MKYGKIILRYKVQNYVGQNKFLDTKWMKLDQLSYKNSSEIQTRKNISKYLNYETDINLNKLLKLKDQIEKLDNKIDILTK